MCEREFEFEIEKHGKGFDFPVAVLELPGFLEKQDALLGIQDFAAATNPIVFGKMGRNQLRVSIVRSRLGALGLGLGFFNGAINQRNGER